MGSVYDFRQGTQHLHRASPAMFTVETAKWEIPKLVHNKIEDAYDEIEFLEFPVTLSAFDMLKTNYRGECHAKDLIHHVNKKVRMVGNYVTRKWVRTIKGDTMAFGTFLDLTAIFSTPPISRLPQSLSFYGQRRVSDTGQSGGGFWFSEH